MSKIRHKTLSVLLASELVMSDISSTTLVPGRTQYLLSLTKVAFSTSVENLELWKGPQVMTHLLGCLLQCPQYEVRKLALEGVLMTLEEEGEEKKTRPQWLDETTLSNLTSQAFHETHPQCLAKVRPHTQKQYEMCLCFLCVYICGWMVYRCKCVPLVYPCV